jgi:hypothetical protein
VHPHLIFTVSVLLKAGLSDEASTITWICLFYCEELIHTLLDLVKTLQELPEEPPNEVKAGFRETGYSASIIVLAVTILESTITRFRYVKKNLVRNIGTTDYFIALCFDKSLCDQVEEIVAVRDSIVHSHIWESQIDWDEQGQMRFVSPPTKLPGFGNVRLKKVINFEKRATKNLELNLFPPRIWRRDAFLTIRALGKGIEYLTSLEPQGLGVDLIPWMSGGWPKNLREIAKSLTIPDYR